MDYKILANKNITEQNIEDLIDDVNAKSISFYLGLNEDGSENIPVEVTTYDSSLKLVSGYYVYWNFWLDKDNPKPFSKLSNLAQVCSNASCVGRTCAIYLYKYY